MQFFSKRSEEVINVYFHYMLFKAVNVLKISGNKLIDRKLGTSADNKCVLVCGNNTLKKCS